MRLQEFASAEEQINLWKLISDTVWHSIKQQAIEQEHRRLGAEKKAPKISSRAKTSKKPESVATPKQSKPPKKQQVTAKSPKQTKQQTASPQPQKPQVLPKVFSNTSKSNLAAPQTPVTSAASLSPQNAAKARSERVTHDPNSVANIQRQLYPLASSDVVKRLTT